MKKLFYFFIVILFFSCGNPVNDHHLKTKASLIDSISNKLNSGASLQNIIYNCAADTKQTPYHGILKASVSWEDKNGKNILLITERPQYFWKDENKAIGKYCEDPDNDTEVAEIFAWHYVFNSHENEWKILWTINDFEFGCCDVEMEYTPWSLHITDLDSNGIAESIFTYASSGGTGPIDNWWGGKLILHLDTLEYSVKGSLGRTDIDRNNDLIYSSNFDQLKPVFKNYSKQIWKRSHEIRDSIFNVNYESRILF